MPTVANKPKAAPKSFMERLEHFGKADVAAALVAYRGLVHALADDPTHEADEEHVAEILQALKIGPADLRGDIEAIKSVRDDESRYMTDAEHAESVARSKEATDKAKAYQEAIPKLQGLARVEEQRRMQDAHSKGSVARRKAGRMRIWGDPAAVVQQVEQGKPTGPKPEGSGGMFYRGIPVSNFQGSIQ